MLGLLQRKCEMRLRAQRARCNRRLPFFLRKKKRMGCKLLPEQRRRDIRQSAQYRKLGKLRSANIRGTCEPLYY